MKRRPIADGGFAELVEVVIKASNKESLLNDPELLVYNVLFCINSSRG